MNDTIVMAGQECEMAVIKDWQSNLNGGTIRSFEQFVNESSLVFPCCPYFESKLFHSSEHEGH